MTSCTALVTGGGGFLGGAIVQRLLARGDRVRSFSRGEYPELAASGVECIRGDLTDRSALIKAVQDCDVVVHVAAKAGIWGDYASYHQPNVVGTQCVIDACRRAGVRRLVYTSSPSVVFDGSDMNGIDETAPYPRVYHAHYPRTKALAEQMVLAANGSNLATVALRPHLIWGPGDNHLVPRILSQADSLRRIGARDPLVDCTYIDNAADAHLLAADRLEPGSTVAGKTYFISNGEPRGVWTLVNDILAACNRSPIRKCIPKWTAQLAACLLENTYRLLHLKGEPRLTKFLVDELTTAHWFNISAARRDLGYAPRISIDEGLLLLGKWHEGRAEKS